jgi:hypothetical protein
MSRPTGSAEDPDAVPARGIDPAELVAGVVFEMERHEIDLPHIVMSRHRTSGAVSYSGPYETAVEALRAADLEHTIEGNAGGGGEITFHVAALYPRLELDRPTGDA